MNKTHHVGYFTDELEAAKAYDTKAKDLHKEYGRFNFGWKKSQAVYIL